MIGISRLRLVPLVFGALGVLVVAGYGLALAGPRGASKLPPGPGNPLANLQQQIDALTQPTVPSALAVYDAEGKQAGVVASIDRTQPPYPVIVLELASQLIPVRVGIAGFLTDILRFEGNSCQGPAMVHATIPPPPSLFATGIVNVPGSTLYVMDVAGGLKSVTLGSYLNEDGQCLPMAQTVTTAYVAPPVVDLDTLYTPPFTIR